MISEQHGRVAAAVNPVKVIEENHSEDEPFFLDNVPAKLGVPKPSRHERQGAMLAHLFDPWEPLITRVTLGNDEAPKFLIGVAERTRCFGAPDRNRC